MAKETQKIDPDIISIDWCDEEIRRELPWDPEQYVTVRRFTGEENRKRQGMAAKFKVVDQNVNDLTVEVDIPELKAYEFLHAIIDFKLKDNRGEFLTFSVTNVSKNVSVYQHMKGRLEDFVEALILEVNKEESSTVPDNVVKEVEGN